MSILSYTTWQQILASAGTTTYSVNFAYELAENLKVNVNGVDLTSDQYTVTGAGLDPVPQTRSITLVDTPSANDVITIWLEGPYDRVTDFTIAGNFSAVNVNTEFDRIFLKMQQLDTQLNDLGLVYDYDLDKTDGASVNKLEKLPANSGSGIPLWTTNSEGDLIAGTLTEDSGCSTLRSELANQQSGTDGSRLIGYYNPTTASSETVGSSLDNLNAAIVGTHFVTGMCVPWFAESSIGVPNGWVFMDGGTIGNASSNATNLHDSGAEDLFKQLWDYTSTDDGWLPLYDSAGGLVARGVSADADWTANRAISLPQLQGKSLASQQEASITYTFTAQPADNTLTPALGTGLLAHEIYPRSEVVTLTTTGNLPSGLATSTNYYVIADSDTTIKLAASLSDSVAGAAITFTDGAPTGVRSLTRVITSHSPCEWMGERDHALTIEEMPAHTHTIFPINNQDGSGSQGPVPHGDPNVTGPSGSTGGSTDHNVMNPTLFCNWLMKL